MVVPTLAELLISALRDCFSASELNEVPLKPAVPLMPPPIPINSALASAVTDEFQPLSSELFNEAAVSETDLVLSLFSIPTTKV